MRVGTGARRDDEFMAPWERAVWAALDANPDAACGWLTGSRLLGYHDARSDLDVERVVEEMLGCAEADVPDLLDSEMPDFIDEMLGIGGMSSYDRAVLAQSRHAASALDALAFEFPATEGGDGVGARPRGVRRDGVVPA